MHKLVELLPRPLSLSAKGLLSTVFAIAALAPIVQASEKQPDRGYVVKSFSTLEKLDPSERLQVRIESQVLVCDPGWRQLYLWDGATAVYISPAMAGDCDVKLGQVLTVEGISSPLPDAPGITNVQFSPGPIRGFPSADRMRLKDAEDFNQRWVEFTGVVRMTDVSAGRLILAVGDSDRTCLVQVLGDNPVGITIPPTGARISVRGVCLVEPAIQGSTRVTIKVPSLKQMRIVSGPEPVVVNAVTSIDALMNRELGTWTNEPVRLSGTVQSYSPGNSVVLKDPTGTIRARLQQFNRIEVGERIELWGYLHITSEEVTLRDAWCESRKPALAESGGSVPVLPGATIPDMAPLSAVADIRKLTNEQAGQSRPVDMRGVVTYVDHPWRCLFVKDGTGGIYIDYGKPGVKTGDYIQIHGVTGAGKFAPIVRASTVEVLYSTNLPAPAKVGLADLSQGQFDAGWVQMSGVIRKFEVQDDHLYLTLNTDGGTFKALLPDWNGLRLTNLVNAYISVEGVCGSELNSRGQIRGITLHVRDASAISLLEPIREDPFDMPLTSIASVGTFSQERSTAPARGTERRVKVRGCVTLVFAGQKLFVQDESGGITVTIGDENQIRAGDLVEVVGFPTISEASPFLKDSIVRAVGSTSLPKAVVTTPEQVLLNSTNDSMMVRLQGQVLHYYGYSARPKLVLQDGPVIYTAHLVSRGTGLPPRNLAVGSKVSLAGICELQASSGNAAEAFRLLVFDPSSIEVLVPVSWWTPTRTAFLAGGLGLLILLSMGWIGLLRRQVAAQTEVIRQKLKERDQFAETLAYERDLLRALMENLPDPLYFKDLRGRFVRASKSKVRQCFEVALEHHKQSAEGSQELPPHLLSVEHFRDYLMRKTDFDFLEQGRAQAGLEEEKRIIASGEPLIGKLEFTPGRDGEGSWCLVTKVPWRDKHGNIIGTFGLSKDITSIKQAEAKLERVHRDLVVASRHAGMAEVATSVLHNVGNVLNSVNVSASVVSTKIKSSKAGSLGLAAELMNQHAADLGKFMTDDPRGQRLPGYLAQLSKHLAEEQQAILSELELLVGNIDHIKEIVTMQQNYAKVAGLAERVNPAELVEDALRMNLAALARHEVEVVKNYPPDLPELTVEKHKVLQVLVNLVRNAKYACEEARRKDKRIVVGIANGDGQVKISIADNGVGIPPENMNRIFNHGFTTRANGHGFGLHSGALAARELGGALRAYSDGAGAGATFVLELPVKPLERP